MGGANTIFLSNLNNKNDGSDMVIREVSVLADVLRKSFSEKSVS